MNKVIPEYCIWSLLQDFNQLESNAQNVCTKLWNASIIMDMIGYQ
jgi:hypothetical protein